MWRTQPLSKEIMLKSKLHERQKEIFTMVLTYAT